MSNKKIYALGFFDGVHRGHQALLTRCVDLASELGALPAAITFDRHPQSLFAKTPPVLINSLQDRLRLLQCFGVRYIHTVPVSEASMSRSWQDFLQELVENGAQGFVCGEDFRFGHQGRGDAQKLRDFCVRRGLGCSIVPEQVLDGVRISSTHIRELIGKGDMENAAKFLGHPHILSGTVVPGRHLGRTIGVPTANILIPEGVVVPKWGVYACKCGIDGAEYAAVTNVGSRPTVGGHQVRAESWVLDFNGDLYGRELTLEFQKFLRPEQKFDSLEELKKQIQADTARTLELLR